MVAHNIEKPSPNTTSAIPAPATLVVSALPVDGLNEALAVRLGFWLAAPELEPTVLVLSVESAPAVVVEFPYA